VSEFGTRAALGTDGIDQDMFAESRTAYFRAREDSLDVSAEQFTDLLAAGGRLASEFFPNSIGGLNVGNAADLIILEYDPPTPLTTGNLAWHWMFAMTQGLVEGVIVEGEWVLRDREFCRIDEERTRAEARTQANRLWQRMESL
jgi:cytosine/adenosine deaminase-related metal-dependent hydrolase